MMSDETLLTQPCEGLVGAAILSLSEGKNAQILRLREPAMPRLSAPIEDCCHQIFVFEPAHRSDGRTDALFLSTVASELPSKWLLPLALGALASPTGLGSATGFCVFADSG